MDERFPTRRHLCPAAPTRPKPIRTHGIGFTASELLAARNSSNETLRRRFICIATHLFVRQDSRIRVAHPLARPLGHLRRDSLRKAFAFLRCNLSRPAVLITSRLVCDSCSFHHDSSAKLALAYQTLPYMFYCICLPHIIFHRGGFAAHCFTMFRNTRRLGVIEEVKS